jgi:hypothetical protein
MVSAEGMREQSIGSALSTQHSTMRGRSSVVESQPSKLAVVGSIPTARSSEDVNRYSMNVKRHASEIV